jgi:hypothetical protein
MSTVAPQVDSLYRVRKGAVEFVDVPELGYLMVDGTGAPGGTRFQAAVGALYTISYTAHFMVKKTRGDAPKVMPLEALWWVEDPRLQEIVKAAAAGKASITLSEPERWNWRAMIVQPSPLDAGLIKDAITQSQAKISPATLENLRFERWAEGRCAQLLHIGPYSAEGPSMVKLHEAIAAQSCRPRGPHHEIYLGDPRRSAPERLRTILRQPVEPA